MTAAQLAQVIPCASATTFSTCAEAARLTSIASKRNPANLLIRLIFHPFAPTFPGDRLTVAEPERNPDSDYRKVQDQAHSQDRPDSPGAEEFRPPLYDDDLVDERPHG